MQVGIGREQENKFTYIKNCNNLILLPKVFEKYAVNYFKDKNRELNVRNSDNTKKNKKVAKYRAREEI